MPDSNYPPGPIDCSYNPKNPKTLLTDTQDYWQGAEGGKLGFLKFLDVCTNLISRRRARQTTPTTTMDVIQKKLTAYLVSSCYVIYFISRSLSQEHVPPCRRSTTRTSLPA